MNWIQRLNPIILREMRSGMRGRRAVIVFTVFVSLLALLTGFIYFITYDSFTSRYSYQFNNPAMIVPMAEFGPEFGRALLIGIIFLLLFLFSLIAPAFGAVTFTGEKERQTYDTLLITNLSARQIVWGKMGAVFALLFLLLLLSLPIQFMAFFFGGVALPELLIATFAIMISILAFSAFGVYISTIARSTTLAVVISYVILVPIVYILPIFGLIFIETWGRFLYNQAAGQAEQIYGYILAISMSIHPFLAAILSGLAAIDGQGYFYYEMSEFLPSNLQSEIWLPAPWIIYCIFSIGLMLLFMALATRRVRKVSSV